MDLKDHSSTKECYPKSFEITPPCLYTLIFNGKTSSSNQAPAVKFPATANLIISRQRTCVLRCWTGRRRAGIQATGNMAQLYGHFDSMMTGLNISRPSCIYGPLNMPGFIFLETNSGPNSTHRDTFTPKHCVYQILPYLNKRHDVLVHSIPTSIVPMQWGGSSEAPLLRPLPAAVASRTKRGLLSTVVRS